MPEKGNRKTRVALMPLFLRLAVYYAAAAAPLFSASIVAGYDRAGAVFWFVLVPAQSVLAYFFASRLPGRGKRAAQGFAAPGFAKGHGRGQKTGKESRAASGGAAGKGGAAARAAAGKGGAFYGVPVTGQAGIFSGASAPGQTNAFSDPSLSGRTGDFAAPSAQGQAVAFPGPPSSDRQARKGSGSRTAAEDRKSIFTPARTALYMALLPLLFSFIPGYPPLILQGYIFGAVILLFNVLVFRAGVISLVFVEPAFIYFVFYRLLDFSRASESVRESASGSVPLFHAALVFAVLFLMLVLYAAAGGRKLRDAGKEMLLFLTVMLPFLVTAVLFIPADYLVNDFVLNFRDEKALSGSGNGTEKGKDGTNLRGVPSERWGGRSRASGSGKQYAVMVVSSGADELYSAWEYVAGFDMARGFVSRSADEASTGNEEEKWLNTLKNQRLLETWVNNSLPESNMRRETSAFFVSAIPERVLPYLPAVIEPTLYSPETYPFSYSYNAVSLLAPAGMQILRLFDPGNLSAAEKSELSDYLSVPLSDTHREIFESYIRENSITGDNYGRRIIKLLESFSAFRYELGYEEDSSVERISRFLSGDFPGDCTEFSNAAALLGRLAGIPTRVVRGYLASESLQTPSHREALMILRESIGKIADIPPDRLLLVTTAHRHSWVQFYLPGIGWTDFETTEYAIPPESGDPNSAGIVIPIIRNIEKNDKVFVFPWKILVSIFITVLLSVALMLYIYKALLFSVLACRAGKGAAASFESMYRYILHRSYLAGYPVKRRTMTPLEHGKSDKRLERFSALFTELYYRQEYSGNEHDSLLAEYLSEYKKLHALTAPRGMMMRLKFIFSMRGVFSW